MLSRLIRVYGIIIRTFGFTIRPLFTFWIIVFYRAFSAVTLALDPLLFPRLGRQKIQKPVFIVGNPRSGTTFLHRYMVKQELGCAFELWQLLYPSMTARTVLRPIIHKLEALSPAKFHISAAHETSLTSVETDDVLVFFRYIDGLFLYGYFLAWDQGANLDILEPDGYVAQTAERDFGWLKTCLRRNLAWHRKDRAISKVFTMALRPEATFRAFPDARMLYMVRDPLEVVPSAMSLVTGVLKQRYPWDRVPEEVRRRYVQRLYQGFLALYRNFHDAWVAGRLPNAQIHIVRYDRMMSDFEAEMTEICAFVGHPMDDKLRESIRATAAKQRGYKSSHKYDLDQYNLTEDQIRRDFAFVYQTYGIGSAVPAPAG